MIKYALISSYKIGTFNADGLNNQWFYLVESTLFMIIKIQVNPSFYPPGTLELFYIWSIKQNIFSFCIMRMPLVDK